MPKLLLVGLVERVCLKTVVREIPGITDCFMNEEDAKNGEKIYSVGPRRPSPLEHSLMPYMPRSRPTDRIYPDCGNTRLTMARISSTSTASTPTTYMRCSALTVLKLRAQPSYEKLVASLPFTRSTLTSVTWS